MDNPLTNTYVSSVIELLESVTGYTLEETFLKENLLRYNIELKQITETNKNQKIIELRLQNETITCYYEIKTSCAVSYLFPDNDEDIQQYINFFNMHYQLLRKNTWLNSVTNHSFHVTNDQDAGYMICCKKI